MVIHRIAPSPVGLLWAYQGGGMPSDLARMSSPSAATMAALDLAAFHLQRVAERLDIVAATARRLAGSTDWQTPSARAFFALATRLAEDVGGLGSLCDTVMGQIALARIRAAAGQSWDSR